MGPAPKYHYAQLDAPDGFRLLSILPGAAPEPIAVEIFHSTLSAHPAYEALSYAWGEADFASQVSAGSSSLAVSTNLFEALQRLRRPDVRRTMWIDALCINQADLAERSCQVGKMRDIYRGAELVIVWVGEESATSNRAIDFLRAMGDEEHDQSEGADKKQRYNAAHIRYGWPVLYCAADNHYLHTGPSSNADWDTLDELVARPWWSRTWVVQEVWSAKQVILQCGTARIKWRTIQEAFNYEDAWDDMAQTLYDRNNAERLDKWKQLKRRYGLALHITMERVNGRGLSDILWNTWDREAADPRDKVFAALELIADETRPHMRADYEKPIVEVYKEAARNILDLENHMDILLAANGMDRTDGLPSWVPDWRREANDHRPTLFVNRDRLYSMYWTGSTDMVVTSECGYAACGKNRPTYEFRDNNQVLRVKAMQVDFITHLTPEFEVDDDPPLWQIDNSWREKRPAVVEESLQKGIDDAVQLASKATGIPTNDEGLHDKVLQILAAGWKNNATRNIARNVMRRRRFFVTNEKGLCIGPGQAAQGDEVWIIAGCNYPMVLRKDRDSEQFGLVGEAYVHGIMEGEAVGERMEPPWYPDFAPRRKEADSDSKELIRPEDVKWQMISIY